MSKSYLDALRNPSDSISKAMDVAHQSLEGEARNQLPQKCARCHELVHLIVELEARYATLQEQYADMVGAAARRQQRAVRNARLDVQQEIAHLGTIIITQNEIIKSMENKRLFSITPLDVDALTEEINRSK